jgi:hypothetical protein
MLLMTSLSDDEVILLPKAFKVDASSHFFPPRECLFAFKSKVYSKEPQTGPNAIKL